jgi:hypothetical protein
MHQRQMPVHERGERGFGLVGGELVQQRMVIGRHHL